MGGIIHSDVAGECTRRYPNRVECPLPKIRQSLWSAVIMSRETEADVRFLGILLLTAPLLAQAPTPAPPSPTPAAPGTASAAMVRVGSMSELMADVIYPASDAIFYITTREPQNDVEWNEFRAKTLILAESANLLMMPGRARDQDRWMADTKLLLDVGQAAFRAAKRKDVKAIEALNDQLYESCVICHQHYRPNYGRRPLPSQNPDAQSPKPQSQPSAQSPTPGL